MSNTVAWISLGVSAAAAGVSSFVSLRQSRTEERLARLNHKLDEEVQRRAALFDRDLKAEEVLTKYRQPLADAAFDLQSRLFNLLRLDFLAKWGGSNPRAEEAVRTTMFRIAQYFGWTEILRRDIQFLSFPEADDTRRVAQLQAEISKRFLTDSYGTALMIWADEQRAIGERMIVETNGDARCMGYASFEKSCDEVFADWCSRLRGELHDDTVTARLRDVQHLLCDLVETLDAKRVRYTQDLERA
jgi:hypothetical protein